MIPIRYVCGWGFNLGQLVQYILLSSLKSIGLDLLACQVLKAAAHKNFGCGS